jgi:predicted metal-dependent peptidase
MIKTNSRVEGFMDDMMLSGSGGNFDNLKREVIEAAENCKKVRGNVPAIYERELDQIKKGKVHWATIFHSLSKQVLFFGKNRSFARPKPYGWCYGLALPGFVGVKKPNITVIFDTSGSITKLEMATFVAEVVKAFQHCDTINVITADCQVNEVVKLNRVDDLLLGINKVKFVGGGGTNFIPALKEAAKLRSELVIYFTDGDGNFGKEIHGMRLLWVLTSSKIIPPFGRYIIINEDAI